MGANKESKESSSKFDLAAQIIISETENIVPNFLEMLFNKQLKQQGTIEVDLGHFDVISAELVIFYVHYIKRTVYGRLEDASKIEQLTNSLNTAIKQYLPPATKGFYEGLYELRNTFFEGFVKLFPDENESPKGTLFWEYSKLICSTYPIKNRMATVGFCAYLPILISEITDALKRYSTIAGG